LYNEALKIMEFTMHHDDWNQHWEDFSKVSLANPVNQYRARLILEKIPDSASHILDIGCGQGWLVSQLLQHHENAIISGVDISEKGIIYAKKKNPKANFFQMDLLNPPQNLPAFLHKNIDTAICTEVLEHVDDPVTFLKNIKTLLKPDAALIITVPGGIQSSYDKYLGHRRHYTKKSLTQLLHAADFKIEKIWQGGFPFFNLYKLLVTLRGKKIVEDAKQTEFTLPFKLLLKLFSFLFHFNLSHSYFGWQLIAVAKNNPILDE